MNDLRREKEKRKFRFLVEIHGDDEKRNGSDQGPMEPGGRRGFTEAGPEARPKELVVDIEVDTGPVWEIVPAKVVQPALSTGGAPGLHSG